MSRLSKRITQSRARRVFRRTRRPNDHLGAKPHDQQQWLGVAIAKDIVADDDAVDADDRRRLMWDCGHVVPSVGSAGFKRLCHGLPQRKGSQNGTHFARNRYARVDRSSATVWYGPITSEARQALVTDRRGRRWPTRAMIPLSLADDDRRNGKEIQFLRQPGDGFARVFQGDEPGRRSLGGRAEAARRDDGKNLCTA